MNVPALSVVIVVIVGIEALTRCLNALLQQTRHVTSEIIIVFDDRTAEVAVLAGQYPAICFLHADGRRTYAELRTLAVRKSHASIIALTEDHFIPTPDWMFQILQAHAQQPFAVIGGAVDKQQPDTLLNWSLYFADYARYMNPVAEGLVCHLTDGNVTYKRPALDEIADSWRIEYHEDEVHRALRARGHALWLSGRIVVQQQRTLTLAAAIRDRYIFGRLFGGRRARRASPVRRILFVICASLLPPLLVMRIARHVLHKRRYRCTFVCALPFVLLMSLIWTWGELVGSVTSRPATALIPRLQFLAPTLHD